MNPAPDMSFSLNSINSSFSHIDSNLPFVTSGGSWFGSGNPTSSNLTHSEPPQPHYFPASNLSSTYTEAVSNNVHAALTPTIQLPLRLSQPLAIEPASYTQVQDPLLDADVEEPSYNTEIDWSSFIPSADFTLYEEKSNEGSSEIIDSESSLSPEDICTNEPLFHQFHLQESVQAPKASIYETKNHCA
jgi:hypothetical protein